jgi:hypothetical protein
MTGRQRDYKVVVIRQHFIAGDEFRRLKVPIDADVHEWLANNFSPADKRYEAILRPKKYTYVETRPFTRVDLDQIGTNKNVIQYKFVDGLNRASEATNMDGPIFRKDENKEKYCLISDIFHLLVGKIGFIDKFTIPIIKEQFKAIFNKETEIFGTKLEWYEGCPIPVEMGSNTSCKYNELLHC